MVSCWLVNQTAHCWQTLPCLYLPKLSSSDSSVTSLCIVWWLIVVCRHRKGRLEIWMPSVILPYCINRICGTEKINQNPIFYQIYIHLPEHELRIMPWIWAFEQAIALAYMLYCIYFYWHPLVIMKECFSLHAKEKKRN